MRRCGNRCSSSRSSSRSRWNRPRSSNRSGSRTRQQKQTERAAEAAGAENRGSSRCTTEAAEATGADADADAEAAAVAEAEAAEAELSLDVPTLEVSKLEVWIVECQGWQPGTWSLEDSNLEPSISGKWRELRKCHFQHITFSCECIYGATCGQGVIWRDFELV